MLEQLLNNREDLQKYLFIRGFLITNNDIRNKQNKFPFYSNWNIEQIGTFQFWTHRLQKLFYIEKDNKIFFLIGHAYNPFNMEHEEINILKDIASRNQHGQSQFLEAVDELTGVFIIGYIERENITFLLDCSGVQYGCYGEVKGNLYISSHMQLLGDLLELKMDSYVKDLINYRWYKYMMGNYLPGDLTAFTEIKRIIPNTLIKYRPNDIEIKRFYPNRPINMCESNEEYNKVIIEASALMKRNMELIGKKWSSPSISLTGGIDSNTTFAAANGQYHKYTTFSYVSMFRESVDAVAAKKISKQFNVKHKIYEVPNSNEEIKDFDIYKIILSHNSGDIGPIKDDDTRKKIILMQSDVCDVEVKSWISETIRAYAYKYFGKSKMPKDLKPRHYTSLYKIFFMNRKLVWDSDNHFKSYLEKTKLKEHLYNYDESDFFVWEMMHGGKCGIDIGTMKFCFDITIPYNNRKLLDLLLKVNLRDRIEDKHHMDMKEHMNKELYDMDIRVINLNETKLRKQFLKAYFTINSILPF
jgi:uncharacterized protein YbcV (DUF1398 family)